MWKWWRTSFCGQHLDWKTRQSILLNIHFFKSKIILLKNGLGSTTGAVISMSFDSSGRLLWCGTDNVT